jgi:hypothetical protein
MMERKDDGMKIRITLVEEMLGTANADPAVHEKFIAKNAPDAPSRKEEIETLGVDEVVEQNITTFSMDDGKPIVWDYQLKGFFKDACGMLGRAKGTLSSELRAYKKIIDGLVFVNPRKIPLVLPEGAELGDCQRPLRAQTAQGERVALAHSKTVPAGTTMEVEIDFYELKGAKEVKDPRKAKKPKATLENLIIEWLDYGAKRGLGQWRNSGKGRFEWEKIG